MQDDLGVQIMEGLHLSDDNSASEKIPLISEGEEILDMGEQFDFGSFEVVRREFFAHTREPSLTFNNCSIYANVASLSKFPKTYYMQVLINRQTKILALRPCAEGEKDSFPWCYDSKGKRKPKKITCRLFYAKIFSMMEWNPEFRYKLLGTVIRSKGEYLLAFDLSSTEVYQKKAGEGEKSNISRTPIYPSSWQNQFGLPFFEHRQSMQINIFDGYAIYAIKDNTAKQDEKTGDEQKMLMTSNTFGGEDNG